MSKLKVIASTNYLPEDKDAKIRYLEARAKRLEYENILLIAKMQEIVLLQELKKSAR